MSVEELEARNVRVLFIIPRAIINSFQFWFVNKVFTNMFINTHSNWPKNWVSARFQRFFRPNFASCSAKQNPDPDLYPQPKITCQRQCRTPGKLAIF